MAEREQKKRTPDQRVGTEHEDMPAASESTDQLKSCLLYTSPSPRDATLSRMPSSA